jgi:SAM-dependent methyltransferase
LRTEFGEIDIYLFDQLLRGRFDGKRAILDAGCGSGRNLVYFLRSGFDMFGVDQDPAAVAAVQELASQLAPHLSYDNFRVGEIDALPWRALEVDAVICSAVLHFARDTAHFRAMLQELWRVLKPGGLFFARLASSIGLERHIIVDANGRARLPDGTDRFLATEMLLLETTVELKAVQLDPLKTTNVENQRCMTTWVLQKS